MRRRPVYWISNAERMAIYLRDGLACTWCGQAFEDGITLSLDHVQPRSLGGGDTADNLITACHRCNSIRKSRSVREFARAAAQFTGCKPYHIEKQIKRSLRRDMTRSRFEAQKLMNRRGGYKGVMGLK